MPKRVMSMILKADLFEEKPAFLINGKGSIQSLLGAFISIAIFVTIVPYGVNNFFQMVNYESTTY